MGDNSYQAIYDAARQIMVFAMVIVVVWFERKEREAAVALRLPPPLPVRLTAVETNEPERRLTLTSGLRSEWRDSRYDPSSHLKWRLAGRWSGLRPLLVSFATSPRA
jgi:hypothetical protein